MIFKILELNFFFLDWIYFQSFDGRWILNIIEFFQRSYLIPTSITSNSAQTAGVPRTSLTLGWDLPSSLEISSLMYNPPSVFIIISKLCGLMYLQLRSFTSFSLILSALLWDTLIGVLCWMVCSDCSLFRSSSLISSSHSTSAL